MEVLLLKCSGTLKVTDTAENRSSFNVMVVVAYGIKRQQIARWVPPPEGILVPEFRWILI
jgi:hypothetical protein